MPVLVASVASPVRKHNSVALADSRAVAGIAQTSSSSVRASTPTPMASTSSDPPTLAGSDETPIALSFACCSRSVWMSARSSGATQTAMCGDSALALRASVSSSISCEKHGRRVLGAARKASTEARPHGSQSGVAKLDDSAQFKPCEKPAW
eukprot:6190452-Pleurochrysis_carterae.AAC.2